MVIGNFRNTKNWWLFQIIENIKLIWVLSHFFGLIYIVYMCAVYVALMPRVTICNVTRPEIERMKSVTSVQTLDWKCTSLLTCVYLYTNICIKVFLMLFVRAEAAQVAELRRAAHGAVRRRPPQGGHVDRRLQLQPHRPEREGPEPRVGHQRRLLLLPTPVLRRLVLLEHRNPGETEAPPPSCSSDLNETCVFFFFLWLNCWIINYYFYFIFKRFYKKK